MNSVASDDAEVESRSSVRKEQLREALTLLRTRATDIDLVRLSVRAGFVFVFAGFGSIYLAWYGASRSIREIEQIPYMISGAFTGLGLIFLGGLMLATAMWASLVKRFERELREGSTPESATSEDGLRDRRSMNGFVGTKSGKLYHRPDCPMVARGKDVRKLTSLRNREPCQICKP